MTFVQRHFENGELLPSSYPLLHFSDAAWHWFEEACADLEIPLDAAKKETLERIYSHLVGVNRILNLTRITDDAGFLKFHVFDSLTVLNLVEAYTDPGDILMDLGSGGGYPGLPLALFCPDRRWTLVDSRAKKAAFLKEALKLTPCPQARALSFRGKDASFAAPELHQKCKMVLCRAVGRADELLPDATALLMQNGIFGLLKGQSYPVAERADLLRALPKAGFTLMEEHNIALDDNDPDRWVILLMKTGR